MKLPPSHVQQLLGRRDREHDRAYDRGRADDVAKRIRSSARWREVRELKRRRNPLCEDCLELGRNEPMTEVHHVVPVRVDPSLAFTRSNLRSLCDPCHRRRSEEERRGA